MRKVRLISFVLILSVAGLSSSFALCVSACADEGLSAAESHDCHDGVGGASIAAGDGTCPHGATVVQQGDVTRDDRTPLTIAKPVVALTTIAAAATAARTPATAHPPTRPVSSRPILRI
ncbi:MAG TPA: hypothetical protein VMO26_25250 [Vicinamibacterales bacterium]|nr:hypothetical protein [Vicinamibacterales bacterium]